MINQPRMSHITREIQRLRPLLAEKGAELVAVSKFHPASAIREAYDAGQRIFGESRVQELLDKQAQLPDDIHWHFIGHLQTNKVRRIIGRVDMIESVDSLRLLDLIDSEALRAGVTARVLLQVHVAQEQTKFGFAPDELTAYFASRGFAELRATHLCGLMGMASNTGDTARIRADFGAIAALRLQILALAPDLREFDILSMGMSGDWPLAVEAGSTHVRIGTDIFGERHF